VKTGCASRSPQTNLPQGSAACNFPNPKDFSVGAISQEDQVILLGGPPPSTDPGRRDHFFVRAVFTTNFIGFRVMITIVFIYSTGKMTTWKCPKDIKSYFIITEGYGKSPFKI
jgi:hypothetical protein